MIETAKALKQFASSFGLPAYQVGTVPKDVELPYIVYPITQPEWNQKATFYLQGWYKTKANEAMLRKADQIMAEIGECLNISTDHGYVVIRPEGNVQTYVAGDERSFYLNLSINSYHMPGV